MKIQKIPSCCTAKIISCFNQGQRLVEGVGEDFQYPGTYIGVTQDDLVQELIRTKNTGYAMVIAFTNNKQKEANKMLKKVGFKSSRFVKKGIHSETKLKLWYITLDNFEA